MSTRLEKEMRREITVNGEDYTVIMTPFTVELRRKRFRNGRVMTWSEFLEGFNKPDTGELHWLVPTAQLNVSAKPKAEG